jgi:hypothetical protein
MRDMIWFFIDALDLHRAIRHEIHLSPVRHQVHRAIIVKLQSHHKPHSKTKLYASTFILLHVLRGF